MFLKACRDWEVGQGVCFGMQELHKVLSDLLERMPNPNPFHS